MEPPVGLFELVVTGSAVRYVVHLITIVDVPAFSVLVPAIGHRDPCVFLCNAAFDTAQPFANLAALAEGHATRALSFSSKGTKPATDMFLWARLSGSDALGDQRSLSLPMLQLGADWSVAPGIVAGLSVSVSKFNASSSAASLQASQVAVQPCLGWAAGNWHGTASVVLGRIDYDALVTSGGTALCKR